MWEFSPKLLVVYLALSPPRYHSEPTVATAVPNLDLGLEPPPLPVSQTTPREETLNRMASKKREKWLKEKGILIWKSFYITKIRFVNI